MSISINNGMKLLLSDTPYCCARSGSKLHANGSQACPTTCSRGCTWRPCRCVAGPVRDVGCPVLFRLKGHLGMRTAPQLIGGGQWVNTRLVHGKSENEETPPVNECKLVGRFICSSNWARTSDPSINSRMLCQLSYGGLCVGCLGKKPCSLQREVTILAISLTLQIACSWGFSM